MIHSTCYRNNKHASIYINADTKARTITVQVDSYGLPGGNVNQVFPADQFGEALDLYRSLSLMVEDDSVASTYDVA